jgi:oligosaccharyltransferase complex subunit alpha (ribophorin I)
MGGWKSNFYVGYNLPSKFHISTEGENYMVNLTYGLPYGDVLAKNYTMKVVLPDGARDVKVLYFNIGKFTN